MTITPFLIGSISLAILVSGCGTPDRDLRDLAGFFQDQWEKGLVEHPEYATTLGDHRYNDRLTDLSLAAVDRRYQEALQARQRLLTFKRVRLGPPDRFNYDLYRHQLDLEIDGHQYQGYLMPLNQMNGLQIDFPNLVRMTPFRNQQDYDYYLTRLEAFPHQVDQVIELLRKGIEEGIVLPRIVLRTVPRQVQAQYEIELQESPFYQPFRTFPEQFGEGLAHQYRLQGRRVIEEAVFAAYRKLHHFLVTEYLPAARTEIGARHLPRGEEYYRHQVRYHTTTDLTPEEIHRIGQEEVRRIRAAMEDIIKQVGFEGSFEEFLEFLRRDPRFYYTAAEDLLNGYRVICKKADPQLAKLFGRLPRLPYGVIPIPAYQAPASPTAYYYLGAADGSRPGNFWANTYKLETRPKYEMEALTLHEAVPGHHLQLALAQEMDDLPEFRRHAGFTAFVEGWALYAESLGEEMGFYQDPYSKFGQLTYEMWRACRLVVDTGMHALGWSRQEAIDFMAANSAKTENDIVVEIDRYITWPGQALAYKLGELKIKDLRSRAEAELGEDFDLRRFHDTVLGNGALPLDVLEDQMEDWLQQERASSRP